PNVHPDSVLPRLSEIGTWWFFAAAALMLLYGLYQNREDIRRDARAAIRPIINAILVLAGGLFLQWTTVRGALHLGFVVMIGAVWFIDWLLGRTTVGFEIRTVGINPNAAKYAGMNVKWNLILAMMLSGGL